MSKKIKAKLLIEVETDFADNLSDEDTVAFCVEQDLEEMGWQINEVKVYKEDDKMLSKLSKEEALKKLIVAGFGHFRGYNQTVKNYLHKIMKVACKNNLAYPYDFGRGKGKYKTCDNISIEDVVKKLQNNPEAIKITEKFIRYYERLVTSQQG